MEEKSKIRKREKYRITIILTDEVMIEKFHRQDKAMETIIEMRRIFPKIFIGGALEAKRKEWEVIWTLNAINKE